MVVGRSASARLWGVADRIEESIGTPAGVAGELRALAAHLMREVGRLREHERPVVSSRESRQALERTLDRDVLVLGPGANLVTVLDRLGRYDSYFGIRRSDRMESEAFLHQVILTTASVVRDLPACLIDSHEIVMMLRGVASGMAGVSGGLGDSPTDCAPADTADEPQEGVRWPAIWRWKVGHHLFNQLAVMSLHLIEAVTSSQDPDIRAALIGRLCDTYRGMTAAMWYAGSFPVRLYADLIRPSMERASQSGSGFSGTDSLDFLLMARRLRSMLVDTEASLGAAWSEPLWHAVWRLYEVQQLDLEHHVIIAQRMVGSAPSLKQIRTAEQCSGRVHMAELSAVDTLRGMAAARASAKAKFLAS